MRAVLTKRGRPRRGTDAVTQQEKDDALQFAVKVAHLFIVDLLIEYGARLDSHGSLGLSAVFERASRDGNTEILDLLRKWE